MDLNMIFNSTKKLFLMRNISLDFFFTLLFLFSILFSVNFTKKQPSKPKPKPTKELERELEHCKADNRHLHEKIQEKREENDELISRNNKLTLLYQTCRKNRTRLEDYVKKNCTKETTTTQRPTTTKRNGGKPGKG
uniref:Uncharacterized protein n=1 Tax=Strongyloides papillosus TaxID=174720 RepID=A0A0N5C2Y0_STREA